MRLRANITFLYPMSEGHSYHEILALDSEEFKKVHDDLHSGGFVSARAASIVNGAAQAILSMLS